MTTATDLLRRWPLFAGLPPDDASRLLQQAQDFQAPGGAVMFDAGQGCKGLPLVLEGSIRVFKRAESGREISLYRVSAGEICIVTVSCLLGGDAYPATGVAESAVSGLVLPRQLFMELVDRHAEFRQVVFGLFAERLSGLMQLVEEVSFRKLDQRLAALLASRAPQLQGSHQQLADELGSVREIVSRVLKQFEERGWIRLGRERIDVLDVTALQALALPR